MDGLGRIEEAGSDVRAHDMDSVEGLFDGDLLEVALLAERLLGDRRDEVFGHLVPVDHLADTHSGSVLAAQGPALAACGHGDLLKLPLSGSEQLLTHAVPLVGTKRVPADDQPLAGELIAGDIGEVALVEERGLHSPGADEIADRRRTERCDPRHPVEVLEFLANAGGGQHPPVANQHHVGEAEAAPDLLDLGGDGGRIARRPFEHLHGERAPIGRAEKPDDDLELPLLVVAAVAALDERTPGALETTRGQVVEDQSVFVQVASGQTALDSPPTPADPVHRGVELVLVDVTESELAT